MKKTINQLRQDISIEKVERDELKKLLGKRMVQRFLRRHTDVNLSALDKYHTEIDDLEQSDSGRTV